MTTIAEHNETGQLIEAHKLFEFEVESGKSSRSITVLLVVAI